MEIKTLSIKERIEGKGLKMTWVADQLGIKYSTLMSYINEFRPMPTEVNNAIIDLIKKQFFLRFTYSIIYVTGYKVVTMKYYLHDSNSFNDEKVTLIYMKYGYEGVGLFYVILEKLAQQEKPIPEIVLKSQLSIGKRLDKPLNFMYKIDILSVKNGEVFSETLLNFSEKYKIKKEKTRKKVAQWRGKQKDKESVTGYVPVSNPSKVKESKVKESKVKERKSFVPPTSDEWINYFKEKGYKTDVAQRSWDYYNIADWYDSKGNKVKNWKQKAISVWFKDENKLPAGQNDWIDEKLHKIRNE